MSPEDLAAEALARAGWLCPPFDVEGVARCLGVTDVRAGTIEAFGALVDGGDEGIVIIVDESLRPSRRRFTVAHEIGHLMIAAYGIVGADMGRLNTERYCDRFAAALLMPRDWLELTVDGRGESIEVLREVASTSGVSFTAALLRLREAGLWRSELMRFTSAPGREWAIQRIPPSGPGPVGVSPDTVEILTALTRGRRDVIVPKVVDLPVSYRGRSAVVRGELSVSSRSVAILGCLERVQGMER